MRSLSILFGAALCSACASLPAPRAAESTAEGRALLAAAADAHGWERYRRLNDINLRHEGRWFGLVARLQPVLVDRDYRVIAEERILTGRRESAMAYSGGAGPKFSYRNPQELALYYHERAEPDRERRDAAALVLDAYRLFLLGPLYLTEHEAIVEHAGEDSIDGQPVERLLARLRPGFGFAPEDRVLAYIGRDDRLLKRLRFSIEGLASTRGAVIEVDCLDYIERDGVKFPSRWFERVKRPVALPAREWWLTGLDLDRGYDRDAIRGPRLTGRAAPPAEPLARR